MDRLKRISRRAFRDAIGQGRDHSRLKALAFALLVKDRCPCSVVKGWTYNGLSRLTGLSPSTCKRHVTALRSMHLVHEFRSGGTRYLKFMKVREPKKRNRWSDGYHSPKGQDMSLDGIDFSSFKTIYMGLQCLCVQDTVRRKGHERQLIDTLHGPKDAGSLKAARRECRRRGLERYLDGGFGYSERGISYSRVASELGVGLSTVTEIYDYGERRGMFDITRYYPIWIEAAEPSALVEAGIADYTCAGKAVRQPANVFTLHGEEAPRSAGDDLVHTLRSHGIAVTGGGARPRKCFMSWDELAAMDERRSRRHCSTRGHSPAGSHAARTEDSCTPARPSL